MYKMDQLNFSLSSWMEDLTEMFQGGAFLINYVSCLSLLCCLVCSLQPCDHLLGKGWPLGLSFPIGCPESGVVFDCINSFPGLEKSTRPLAMASALCCRTSRNFDFPMLSIEFTNTYGDVGRVKNLRIFHPCFLFSLTGFIQASLSKIQGLLKDF